MPDEKLVSRWLVSTDWLAAHLDDPTVAIVDGSFYLPALKRDAEAEFLAAHIPGAVRFDIDAIADKSNPLPHMLPAADQFAWGVTAYEVLTGELPWGRHDKAVRLVQALLTRDPPPLAAYRPFLPQSLDSVLRRCLAKSDGARFSSMAEVVAALGAV